MVEAYRTGDYTMKDIADYFNVRYSAVSRAIKKTEVEMLDCNTCSQVF